VRFAGKGAGAWDTLIVYDTAMLIVIGGALDATFGNFGSWFGFLLWREGGIVRCKGSFSLFRGFAWIYKGSWIEVNSHRTEICDITFEIKDMLAFVSFDADRSTIVWTWLSMRNYEHRNLQTSMFRYKTSENGFTALIAFDKPEARGGEMRICTKELHIACRKP
jgi:hypothetical protein